MRGIFTFLALSVLSFACVCNMEISNSFLDFTSHIKERLQIQSESLSLLTQSIKNNIQTQKSQNTLLNKELALLKQESLQSRELLFLLKQKNQLE